MTAMEMETLSFRVEGIAQALYAISTSSAADGLGWALDLLAREADSTYKELKAHEGLMLKHRHQQGG